MNKGCIYKEIQTNNYHRNEMNKYDIMIVILTWISFYIYKLFSFDLMFLLFSILLCKNVNIKKTLQKSKQTYLKVQNILNEYQVSNTYF